MIDDDDDERQTGARPFSDESIFLSGQGKETFSVGFMPVEQQQIHHIQYIQQQQQSAPPVLF